MTSVLVFVAVMVVIETAMILYVRIAYRDEFARKSDAPPYPGFTPDEIAMIVYVAAGAAVGAYVGFLLRPSAPIIGQLPLETVLNRGTNLQGLDTVLVGTAKTSFNHVLGGLSLVAACWPYLTPYADASQVPPLYSSDANRSNYY